ncbi:MAG: acyl-CoA dehydrogenase family protein [Proteobacteria bacterium]|nr:acyl-CoA dehydrogenase family protein [Pseudomonadota bacterium]
MDFNDTPEEAAFRTEVRGFLDSVATRKSDPQDTWDKNIKSEPEAVEIAKEWQRTLHKGGWACLHWPKEYGGRAASAIERVIWDQEESQYLVPKGFFTIGLGMAGPTIMTYGNDEQKAKYLPDLVSADKIWCQLFSEPVAGSDLAGIRTKSEKDGDDWIINGQKIWTSGAHYSDWGIIVTRSDPTVAKHKGMTYFMVDMKSPGVEVRPIKQITGGSGFNEVFFTDVRIPDNQRLGSVGDGWNVALATLMNERVAVGERKGVDIFELIELAKNVNINGKPAIEDGAVRNKLAKWYCEFSGMKFTRFRSLSAMSRGEVPGPENSIGKLVGAGKSQDMAEFGMMLMDRAGMISDKATAPFSGMFQQTFMQSPSGRIAGGSDEILRNVIAERVLGLPQEPRADKGMPYNEIPTGTIKK